MDRGGGGGQCFWVTLRSAPRVVTSEKVQFSEHAQSNGTNKIQNGCSQSSRFPIPLDKGKEGFGIEICPKIKILHMSKNVSVLDYQGPLHMSSVRAGSHFDISISISRHTQKQ